MNELPAIISSLDLSTIDAWSSPFETVNSQLCWILLQPGWQTKGTLEEKMTFLEFLGKKKTWKCKFCMYLCSFIFKWWWNTLKWVTLLYLSTFLFLCLFGSLFSMYIIFRVLFGMLNGQSQNQAPNSGIYLWFVS